MIFKKFLKIVTPDSYRQLVEDLNTGLTTLSFDDNFEVEKTEALSISTSGEVKITHSFGVVPRYFLIVRQTGNGNIVDGDTAWNDTTIYLKNVGAATAVVTVLLFK